MTKTFRKAIQVFLGVIFTVALVFGISLSVEPKTAKAAEVNVTFTAILDSHINETYGTSIRFDTSGKQWTTYKNWELAADHPSISDYTTVNGRTVTEINAAATNGYKITLQMQPAGTFSFLRLYIPEEIMPISDVKSMGILDGWSYESDGNVYKSSAMTFLRNGDAMVEASSYNAMTKVSNISISDLQVANRENSHLGADSYVFDVDMGIYIDTTYNLMYSSYRNLRNAVYINGKSVEEWNAQMISQDERFGDPTTYTVFPQNSQDASHIPTFAKPVGIWATSTGFRLTVFQELLASCSTIKISVGNGCHTNSFMVSETATRTFTQTVVDITEMLTFLDNSNNVDSNWGPTKLYYIHTAETKCWTKAPKGGSLNESDASGMGGGQLQMKYVYFNGTSIWDINVNDNNAYGSTQENIIKESGQYAPILVMMSAEAGSSLKLAIPTAYTNGKSYHEEIVIKRGFCVYEDGVSYYVTNDIVFKNNGTSWTKEIRPIEIQTQVTSISTRANESFVVFHLSNNDYAGLHTTAISDVSSLYGYIDIGGSVVNERPTEPYFNVWGIQNSVAFRAPGLDATGVKNIEYVTIKNGAKFPAYTTQNGGKTTYYVTTEDVTFVHDIEANTWTQGSEPTRTVTFTVDGNVYQTQEVKNKGLAVMPEAPTKTGDTSVYTFKEWQLDGSAYDFSTPVSKDITLVASFDVVENAFSGSAVTMGNVRIDGTAKELYKVDIVSSVFNIDCNPFDFMYAGYADARKHIYINGVSVFDINANIDDSSYVYSTSPMTGHESSDELFAHPVLLYSPKVDTLTLWIHKDYFNSLGNDVTITLKAGYNTKTNGLELIEDVSYKPYKTVSVNDGTNTKIQYVLENAGAVMPTPYKPATSTSYYNFEGWYYVGTDEVFDFATPITENIEIEARFTEVLADLIETEVVNLIHHLKTDREDSWLIIHLSNHDYASVRQEGIGYEEILRIGMLEKIILKGEIVLKNGTTVSEATLKEVYDSYGPGEAVFLNIWDYYDCIALRVRATGITEIVVEEGCCFPSYGYITGTITKDTRYFVKKTTVYSDDDNNGSFYKPADIYMEDGAAVRIASSTDNSGLRFQTNISKATILELQRKLDSGEYKDVSFGTLIIPTDYLAGGLFTHAWLTRAEVTFLDVPSSANLENLSEWPVESDGYYSYYGSIVRLKETNYAREFSGVGYIKLTDSEDNVSYVYAHYNVENSRSAAFVAQAATLDRSNEQADGYANQMQDGSWSPYDTEAHTLLNKYVRQEGSFAPVELTSLYTKGGEQTISIDSNNQKLNGAYVELVYSTNVNVWGVFTYTDGTKTVNEDFYLQAGTSNHRQYLDIYRKNGVGYGMKAENISMTSIKFINAELEQKITGKVKIFGLYSSAKNIDMQNQEVYVTVEQKDGSEMTVGAHLGLGGALTYLAKSGIYEGVIGGSSYWKNGTVAISTVSSVFDSTNKVTYSSEEAGYYGHATSSKPGDGAVNLINNFDAGRQIQQSWYAHVGDATSASEVNGYKRAYCYTESTQGKYWPYNPVQAGDVVSNPSQIVDYEVNEAKGYIYVKARAMDWAKGDTSCVNAVEGGVTTKSYVENYYRLNKDGTLYVDNRFIDWNGFTDMESCDFASTELPACYPVHTLNYYVSNFDGDGTWEDGLEYKNDLSSWSNAAFHQYTNPSQNGYTLVENWFAWANGNSGTSFGMGFYIPNVTGITAGRSLTSTAYYTDANFANSNALPVTNQYVTVSDTAQRGNILFDKGLNSNMQEIKYTYQSAYVSNTSYTAPGVNYRMLAFVPIEYTYVICLGQIDDIRNTFHKIYEQGDVTNAGQLGEKVGLDAWPRADKSWTLY